jgi:hypothetical protein
MANKKDLFIYTICKNTTLPGQIWIYNNLCSAKPESKKWQSSV